jgi:steroid delta-isomerase-like uncharacterized protein
MSTENLAVEDSRDQLVRNKDVIRQFMAECVNVHREDLLGRFVDEAVTMHPGTTGAAPPTEGLEELRQAFRRFRVTFPDLHVTLEDLIAERDLVVARWTGTGSHSAEFAGIPATGTTARWGGTDIYRLADGRIVEWWRNDDYARLLQQLGRRIV